MRAAVAQKENPRVCTVKFTAAYDLPDAVVQLPVNPEGFPAEFKFSQERHWSFMGGAYSSNVTTSYDGRTQSFRDSLAALNRTIKDATQKAFDAAGEKFESKREELRNKRSYEGQDSDHWRFGK